MQEFSVVTKFPLNIQLVSNLGNRDIGRDDGHSQAMIQLSIQPVTQEFLDGAKGAHHALFIQVTMQDDICQPGFAQHSALRIKEAEINIGEIIDEQQHKRPVDWVVVGKAAMIPPGRSEEHTSELQSRENL